MPVPGLAAAGPDLALCWQYRCVLGFQAVPSAEWQMESSGWQGKPGTLSAPPLCVLLICRTSLLKRLSPGPHNPPMHCS